MLKNMIKSGECMSETKYYLQLLRKGKSNWTELERHFVKQRRQLAVISEILVSESKLHMSSDEAIMRIRRQLNEMD